jgi:hypothetical protein
MGIKELPTQRTRDRFIELGDQFSRVYAELRDCHNQSDRPRLVAKMRLVVIEADDLVQKYHENFDEWPHDEVSRP